jgi:two-component system response regulator FixJ
MQELEIKVPERHVGSAAAPGPGRERRPGVGARGVGRPARASRGHVALVDDDAGIRDAAALLLGELGYDVSRYRDGDEFLAQARIESFQCILLDLSMPRLDGLAVLRALGQRRGAAPVVLLTGHADVPLAVTAMRAGAFNLLQKPCSPAALVGAVEEAVARAAAAREDRLERSDARTRIERLAPRQRQVMAGLVRGHQNKTIAARLGLSVRTIEAHRRVVMRKLEARSLSDVLRCAVAAGLSIDVIDYDGDWEPAGIVPADSASPDLEPRL